MSTITSELRSTILCVDKIAQDITREHNTNEATIIHNMIQTLIAYAKLPHSMDLRNEAAVSAAKRILDMDTLESLTIPYI